MKKVLLLLCLVAAMTAQAQKGCNCDLIPQISGSVNFNPGMMATQIKVGLWRNVRSSDFTGFVGYEEDAKAGKITFSKIDQTIRRNTLFAEVGYRQRLTPWLFLHSFGGINNFGPYMGTEALVQANWNLIIGTSYRKEIFGITIYVRPY